MPNKSKELKKDSREVYIGRKVKKTNSKRSNETETVVFEQDEKKESLEIEEEGRRLFIKRGNFNRLDEELKIQKSDNQRLIDSLEEHEILEVPEFLLNDAYDDQRRNVITKLMELLKYRYSLTIIADVLQCNNYDELDEIVSKRLVLVKKINEIISSSENSEDKNSKMFARFKSKVGDNNSRIYSEQESNMKILLEHIINGKYFERGKMYFENGGYETIEEANKVALQDVIAKIIDHPHFNLSCEIESKFLTYEYDRVLAILEEANSRNELSSLIEEVKTLSRVIAVRSEAYETIDKLVSGKSTSRIKLNDKAIESQDSEGR
jgi:hypothetical protein